jgi:hypothetical protein
MYERGNSVDPAQIDLRWFGYHPRAMLPVFVLAAAVSLVLWTGRWFLDDLSELADRVGTLALFAMAWGVWPVLAALFLYRTITYTYRLTDRTVLAEFGFLSRPVPPIALADATAVTTGGGWLARRLGVGWVEVNTRDRVVRLSGVRNPVSLAIAIRQAMEKGRPSA